jgi:hypothetical protein
LVLGRRRQERVKHTGGRCVRRPARPGTRVINGITYGPPPIFTKPKGKTLTTWLRYALCAGQRTAAHLGYAPLPATLIKAAFTQLNHVPGHISPPTTHQLTGCIKTT